MNISRSMLLAQYRRGLGALPWLHDVERSWHLPSYSMFAMWSRETNVDLAYLHGKTGDFGYGHGPFQLDNHPQNWSSQRQADCDRIDSGDMPFAAAKAAEELAANLRRCGSSIGMYNAYNSGHCGTAGTAGGDYGPDVEERRQTLLSALGPPKTRRREDDER